MRSSLAPTSSDGAAGLLSELGTPLSLICPFSIATQRLSSRAGRMKNSARPFVFLSKWFILAGGE
jgi:hypothetical protein